MICVSAETKTWMKSGNKPRIKTVRDRENMNIEERLNVKSKPPRTPTLRGDTLIGRSPSWSKSRIYVTVNDINRDASLVIALR